MWLRKTKKNEAEGNLDRVIKEEFFPGDKTTGVFVDVGPPDPTTCR